MRFASLLLAGLAAVPAVMAGIGDAYMPGRLSVRFLDHPLAVEKDGQLSLGADFDHLLELYPLDEIEPLYKNLRRTTTPDLSLNYVLHFDNEADMEAIAGAFESTGKVEYAEPDYLMPVSRTPNDPSISNQFFLGRMDCYDAWDLIPETPDNPDMIIAVIDSGVDWNHPDLINNIWVNPGEDVDGDGYIPTGSTPGDMDDINGADDDGNGLVDDFYGWDYVTGVTGCATGEDCSTTDNNPMDFDGHGTHCSGLSAATTNNGIGVASAAWDARVMCMRAGYHAADGGGYVLQTAAAQSIYYAIENGASIISMSFGGSSTIRTPSTVAYNSGLLCFHAAGNDNISTADAVDYAQGMISVASTTSSDCKSDFSNYGTWIDVSAPGSNIYSTMFNNTYASLYGTSMACPNAASVAALLWWNFPDLTHTEVRERLLGTVDIIDNLACNSSYVGLLGTGRVNAYKALANIRDTNFELIDLAVSDTQGDYRFMPGDTIRVDYTVNNLGINPTGELSVTISTEDTGVTVLTPEIAVPQLPVAFAYNTADYPQWAGYVVVDEVTEGRFLQLAISVTTDNADDQSGEIELMLGTPSILLYDDSENLDLYTVYYTAFRELDWPFDWYQASSASYPMMEGMELDMTAYGWTLYASGASTSTVDEAEQAMLADYVDAGHGLIFVSQHADEDIAESDFFTQVLEAQTGEQENTTHRAAYGVEGSFTEGEMMILQGAGGANNQNLPISEILPAADGETIYLDNAQAFSIGIHNGYDADGRVVYLNFALESAAGLGGTVAHYTAIANLADYLNGTDVQEEALLPVTTGLAPAWPNPFNPVTQLNVQLNTAAHVNLAVYNMLGQQVAQLLDGELQAGSHTRAFDASDLASGMYLARLLVDGQPVGVQKLMLVR